MPDWIRPGARCVQHREWPPVIRLQAALCGVRLTERGSVYVVREVISCGNCRACPLAPYLTFEEIRNDREQCIACGSVQEKPFPHAWFRPVRETSIEDLRSLLSPTPGTGAGGGGTEGEDLVRRRQDELVDQLFDWR